MPRLRQWIWFIALWAGGVAVTGGFELALNCDFLVASENAKFGDTHARVGVQPGWGLSVLLPQAIGIRRAREMSFTGNFIDAHEAKALGLVNHVVDGGAEGVLALARQIAEEIAANSPLAVEGTKSVLAANDGRTVDEGLAFVADHNTMYISSNDLIEAMTAFMEKRPPNYTGS